MDPELFAQCGGPAYAFSLSGFLGGYCGAAIGSGLYGWYYRQFDVAWAGSTVSFSGAITGVLHVTIPPGGCENGTATSFRAAGSLVFNGVDACAGNGTMDFSPGLDFGTTKTVSFYVGITVGACASLVGTFSASGTLTGTCSSASGWGVTSDGQYFDVTLLGTVAGNYGVRLILTGNVIGEIRGVNDVLSGSNCGTSSTRFITGSQLAKLR